MRFIESSFIFTTMLVMWLPPHLAHTMDVEVSEATSTTLSKKDLLCMDIAEEGTIQCQEWALIGECEKNPEFMEDNCRKACGWCGTGNGIDINDENDGNVKAKAKPQCVDLASEGEVMCREWAWHGECTRNEGFMKHKCAKSCGFCHVENNDDDADDDDDTKTDADSSSVTTACKDSFDVCSDWASQGLCSGFWTADKGPYKIDSTFVVHFCPQSCGVCNIHLDERDWKLGMGFPQTAPELNDSPEDIPIVEEGTFDIYKGMKERIQAKVAETAVYMLSLPTELRQVCKFGHIHCARLTLDMSECTTKAGHYIFDYLCAAACHTCDKFEDPVERSIAEDHFQEALEDVEKYIEYQKHLADKEKE